MKSSQNCKVQHIIEKKATYYKLSYIFKSKIQFSEMTEALKSTSNSVITCGSKELNPIKKL